MKYLLSSFGIHNPYIVSQIPDHAVYPIGVEGDDFVDLDYSPLLAGTGFIFDSAALEYLDAQKSRLVFLSPLVHSIHRLEQEGLLEKFDGKAIVRENLRKIQHKTEQLCEDYVGWLRPVRAQWQVLRRDRVSFLKKFGSAERREINEHHFAVANAVLRIDDTLNSTLLGEITRLIESRRCTFSSKERGYVKEVLRPLVCHTVIQDLMRYKTGASVLDWDDSQPYYERLYATRWEQDEDRLLARHTRNLFTLSLPELRPKSVDAVIRFVRDGRNVRGLRRDVAEALANGEKFDESLGRRIVREVLESELTVKRRMKKLRFLGAALNLLVPAGSLLTEAAIEGGTVAAEDAVEGGQPRAHRWFYSLTEGQSDKARTRGREKRRGKWWPFGN